jgi:hypothetical protein
MPNASLSPVIRRRWNCCRSSNKLMTMLNVEREKLQESHGVSFITNDNDFQY